jgi:PAS domain S-box-containing protein
MNRAAPARAAAAFSILVGVVCLAGWGFGFQALTSVLPGAAEMKVNTALAAVLCGAALMILADLASKKLERTAQALSTAVLLLGLATLAEYSFGWNLGIDELLVRDVAGVYNPFPGRMSPMSALAFVAFGSALAVMPRDTGRAVQMGAGLGLAIGLVSLLGYAWNASELTTDRWLPPVAVNTAVCFVLLGIGILIAPRLRRTQIDLQIASLAAVEFKILAGFMLALSLLLVAGAYTYRATARFADSVEWVAHSQEVRASLASAHGSLAGAEVAMRDYLLTQNAANRGEYERQRAEVLERLNDVESLTRDNPTQRQNLAALRPIVAGRLAAMTSALRAFEDFGIPAARAVISVTRMTNATQAVHAQTERMDREEVRLLAERQKAAARVRNTTLVSLLATLAVATLSFAALFRGVHREMRARRDAERALRASDLYNRTILESSPDCLGVLTLDGRLTQMTPHGRKLMDIDDFSTVENSDWIKVWTGADRVAAEDAYARARSGTAGRFQGFCPTLKGTPKWWDVIVMPILGADGRPESLLAVARDISEVKRTEDDLRETNRFLDSLIDNLPVIVEIKDATTLAIVRHNHAFEQLLGFSSDQVTGKGAHDLFSAEEADFIVANDREALVQGRLIVIPEQRLQTGNLGMRTFHTMKLPINDLHGKAQFLLAISVDITERKLAEQAIRELNSALEAKAAQLEATNSELESFSYSVSHDLRAPLRAIDGFALMIEEDFKETLDPEGRRYLSVIRENSKRMGALIDDLLTFSRLGRLPVVNRKVNVDSLVREVIDEIVHAPPAAGHPAAALPEFDVGRLPAARGDRGLLRQVWMNLLSNAVKYSGKAGIPQITVRGHQTDSENLYSVRDNGVGFDMEYVEKLFGVFQRLHRADEFSGTGVGLAIVQRVVARHGGRVWAEGKINEGAVFSFALPRGTDGE